MNHCSIGDKMSDYRWTNVGITVEPCVDAKNE
jgi:hypothetical protein